MEIFPLRGVYFAQYKEPKLPDGAFDAELRSYRRIECLGRRTLPSSQWEWWALVISNDGALVPANAIDGFERVFYASENPPRKVIASKALPRLQWVGSKCGHREDVGARGSDAYIVGESEPCVHCGDRRCVAVVELLT